MNILVIIVLSSVMFFLGVFWHKMSIGNAQKFQVNSELEIQVSPQHIGVIPAGTILYKFRDLPEISTYFLFVNLKEKNILSTYTHDKKFNLIAPVTAYPQKSE